LPEVKVRTRGLYAIRTTVGQERNIAMLIAERARSKNLNVYSVIALDELRGYLIIEAKTKHDVQLSIIGLPHVRSKIIGNFDISEIEHFLAPKPVIEGLEVGDIVEIIGGPFKGEKAIIVQMKPEKEEVTLQLLGSSYPIPVIVNAGYVKLIEKGHKEEES